MLKKEENQIYISQNTNIDAFKNTSFLSGLLIIIFISLLFIFSSFLFLIGHSISKYVFYLSIIITIFSGCYISLKYFTGKVLLYTFIVLSVTILISFVLSLVFFDISYDGQGYHEEAIVQLANGWNPIYRELYSKNSDENLNSFLWNNHYPKASEISQASLYKVTNLIESGKTINLLLIFASFFLVFSCLCNFKKIKMFGATLLSMVAVLNPVVVSQSLTFYVDGELYSVLLCFLSVLYLFYLKQEKYLMIILVLMGIYFMNIKFTAVAYFLILSTGFLVIVLLNRKYELFKKVLPIFAGSLLLSAFIFGYNPYVSNYVVHGNPFYPVKVSNRSNPWPYDKGDRPINIRFNKMNRFNKILVSLFAKSTDERDIQMKIPLMFNKNEILAFSYPDVRLGGFGPLFSGIVIINIVLLCASLMNFRKNKELYIAILFILFSVFINPECWWARYVPQVWLIPIFTIIFLSVYQKGALVKSSIVAGTLLIFLNVLSITIPYVHTQLKNSHLVSMQLKDLAKKKMPLKVEFVDFRANRVRLNEHNIRYIEVDDISDEESTTLYGSDTKIQN